MISINDFVTDQLGRDLFFAVDNPLHKGLHCVRMINGQPRVPRTPCKKTNFDEIWVADYTMDVNTGGEVVLLLSPDINEIRDGVYAYEITMKDFAEYSRDGFEYIEDLKAEYFNQLAGSLVGKHKSVIQAEIEKQMLGVLTGESDLTKPEPEPELKPKQQKGEQYGSW